jgi:hypothetical protein
VFLLSKLKVSLLSKPKVFLLSKLKVFLSKCRFQLKQYAGVEIMDAENKGLGLRTRYPLKKYVVVLNREAICVARDFLYREANFVCYFFKSQSEFCLFFFLNRTAY